MGGILSLTFEEKLSFFRAVLLLFSGGVTAGYSVPVLVEHFSLTQSWAAFISFCLGISAMRIINVFIAILEIIKKDPTLILSLVPFFKSNYKNGGNSVYSSDTDSNKSDIHTARKDSETGE